MNPRPPEPEPVADTAAVVDEAWAHRGALLAYARRLLGAHAELAEDVVQEAFLRLHQHAAAGAPARDPRPWLFRVTRNLALDERRRLRRGQAARSSLEVVQSQPSGPHEVVQRREEARRALEGLGSLPPRERRTVILEQAGLAPPAIARLMDTTTNAVHQSLFRARRRLREVRAAAWCLLPLPFVRLLVRAAASPVVDRLPVLAPGSGGRFGGGAGLVGLVAAAAMIGGVTADHTPVTHPSHVRSSAVPTAPPAPVAARVADPSDGRTPLRTPAKSAAAARSRGSGVARRTSSRTPAAAVVPTAPAHGSGGDLPRREEGESPDGVGYETEHGTPERVPPRGREDRGVDDADGREGERPEAEPGEAALPPQPGDDAAAPESTRTPEVPEPHE